jgi:hypothetical protein
LNELRNMVVMLDHIRSYHRPCPPATTSGFSSRR